MKRQQLKKIERISSKRVPRGLVISPEVARSLSEISREIKRQIGLLIHRSGKIESVIIGTHGGILIPQLTGVRSAGGRLKGLRLVHTHLADEDISNEDLMDLLFLRLDLLSVIKVAEDGLPKTLHSVHLIPEMMGDSCFHYLDPVHPAQQVDSAEEIIEGVEDAFARNFRALDVDKGQDRAILISVSTEARGAAEESMNELVELVRSDNIVVLDTVIQRRRKVNPKFILGKGKLAEIMILALQRNANLLIFNQELNPSQVRSITSFSEMRVIDRTQLILDIFAHRARSREGKLQVEMAQLKYLLPHLSSRDDSLSRLTGGIGARGPGETKLEIDKRRINDRLARLAKELKNVSRERFRRRNQRRKKDLPVISLVGYTNAGKSTLLNTLTNSEILAEDKLFATLDPTSRRLRFPHEIEVIVTDTVGFIRDLPKELMKAFKSTLEELQEADLLVHVIDVSNPLHKKHICVVESILKELELTDIPCLKVYNKIDKLEKKSMSRHMAEDEVAVSAVDAKTLSPFLHSAQRLMEKRLSHQMMKAL